jgi:hypothetical protein
LQWLTGRSPSHLVVYIDHEAQSAITLQQGSEAHSDSKTFDICANLNNIHTST